MMICEICADPRLVRVFKMQVNMGGSFNICELYPVKWQTGVPCGVELKKKIAIQFTGTLKDSHHLEQPHNKDLRSRASIMIKTSYV